MKLNDVKKLHQKKYRTQLGFYLVEGEHLILELDKAAKSRSDLQGLTLYVTEAHEEWANMLQADYSVTKIDTKRMAQLSDTKSPQGIIALVPLPNLMASQAAPKLVRSEANERSIYLHEIQDPGNLGTILRTLAWFGNFRLLLSPNCVDPFNPKVVRASMGAIFHVPIEFDVEVNGLQNRFEKFAYLDMQGASVNTSRFSQYDCYLFGNEARGVPREALSACKADAFTIAGCGKIDSLNLASAVNICVYQLSL